MNPFACYSHPFARTSNPVAPGEYRSNDVLSIDCIGVGSVVEWVLWLAMGGIAVHDLEWRMSPQLTGLLNSKLVTVHASHHLSSRAGSRSVKTLD